MGGEDVDEENCQWCKLAVRVPDEKTSGQHACYQAKDGCPYRSNDPDDTYRHSHCFCRYRKSVCHYYNETYFGIRWFDHMRSRHYVDVVATVEDKIAFVEFPLLIFQGGFRWNIKIRSLNVFFEFVPFQSSFSIFAFTDTDKRALDLMDITYTFTSLDPSNTIKISAETTLRTVSNVVMMKMNDCYNTIDINTFNLKGDSRMFLRVDFKLK